MGLPVNGEMGEIIALVSLGLPTGVGSHRSDDLNPQVALTLNQQVGIDIARIQEMFTWKEVFLR